MGGREKLGKPLVGAARLRLGFKTGALEPPVCGNWGYRVMPDTIRTSGGRPSGYPRRGGIRIAVTNLLTPTLLAVAVMPAAADDALQASIEPAAGPSVVEAYLNAFALLDRHEIVQLAITLSILCFAVVAAILLVRTRARPPTPRRRRATRSSPAAPRSTASTRCCARPQILVAWPAGDDEPEIIGDIGLVTDADAPYRVLAFGLWLAPDAAQAIETAVTALRERGEKFSMTLTTPPDGRSRPGPGGGRARDPAPQGRERHQARIRRASGRYQHQVDDATAMRTLIEAMPSPVWARDEAGKLTYVNAAYARAIDARDTGEADAGGTELFDRAARTDLFRAHEPSISSPAACPRSSPAAASPSTCSRCRPAAAASASASTPPKPTSCASR